MLAIAGCSPARMVVRVAIVEGEAMDLLNNGIGGAPGTSDRTSDVPTQTASSAGVTSRNPTGFSGS